jgi:hypothetical protein
MPRTHTDCRPQHSNIEFATPPVAVRPGGECAARCRAIFVLAEV